MKHSASYLFFFACLSFFHVCASTTATKSNKRKCTAVPVELGDQRGVVRSRPPKQMKLQPEKPYSEHLASLLENGGYDEIVKQCKERNGSGWKYLYPLITLDNYKHLFGALEANAKVSDFFVNGQIMVVKKVIFETEREFGSSGEWNSICDAIALSLNGDRLERVADLLAAAHENPSWKNELGGNDFEGFIGHFFERYDPEKNSMPLKRFLTLHGEEFGKKHPETFQIICQELAVVLKGRSHSSVAQKLLSDLVRQPSLLTPATFALVFLCGADDTDRVNFVKHGYKEAIEEGLKEIYDEGYEKLWDVLVDRYPSRFSGGYPSTDDELMAVLKCFKTKRHREEEWAEENAPIFLPKLKLKLRESDISFLLPLTLWNIIVDYAATGATWVDV